MKYDQLFSLTVEPEIIKFPSEITSVVLPFNAEKVLTYSLFMADAWKIIFYSR